MPQAEGQLENMQVDYQTRGAPPPQGSRLLGLFLFSGAPFRVFKAYLGIPCRSLCVQLIHGLRFVLFYICVMYPVAFFGYAVVVLCVIPFP